MAWSTDGGTTWSPLCDDSALVDPGNNGSILRYDDDAPNDDPRSHWLLFSNTASATDRRNLTVRLSYDGGQSWPVRWTVDPGPSGYSTLARLPGDRFGVLYERDGYRFITLVVKQR